MSLSGKREVALFVDCNCSRDREHFSFTVQRLDLAALCSADDVQVCYHLSLTHKETASRHQGFAVRVVSGNGDHGGIGSECLRLQRTLRTYMCRTATGSSIDNRYLGLVGFSAFHAHQIVFALLTSLRNTG